MAEKEVRLDKWLWAARFYKTRSIAKAMIESGKVHYNNQRAKVSKIVEVGAMLKQKKRNKNYRLKRSTPRCARSTITLSRNRK